MRFETPWVFWLLLIIPLIIALYMRTRAHGSLRFSTTTHAKRVKKSLRQRFMILPLLLRILILMILIVILARPQEGKEQVRKVSEGIAIEMVIDRSGSMGAEMEFGGERYNRLQVVKKVFNEFVTGKESDLPGRPNDLIGMIAFARYADTIAPLTLAHGALSQFLEGLQLVKRRDEDGTGIGDGVALAAARLRTAEETLSRQSGQQVKNYRIKSKIIILLTDGQNNIGKRDPMEAAELARKWGIKIYTIGVGGSEGLMRQYGLLGSFLTRTDEGVNKKTLQSMAKITGGRFWMAGDAESLRDVYQEIDRMERSEIESVRYLDYREQFQPFLFIVLGLLVIEILLSCTFYRRIP